MGTRALHTPTAASTTRRRLRSQHVLVGLLLFQGVSAVGGGTVLVLDPSGQTMGWTTDMLAGTSFATYLWPGWILAMGLGVPALALAWGVAMRPFWQDAEAIERVTGHHWSWIGSIMLGIGLMGWILGQVTLIDVRSFLQPVMFLVGAAITGTALLPSVRDSLAGY